MCAGGAAVRGFKALIANIYLSDDHTWLKVIADGCLFVCGSRTRQKDLSTLVSNECGTDCFLCRS